MKVRHFTLFALAASALTIQLQAASVINYWNFDTLSAGAPVDVVGGVPTSNVLSPDISTHASYGEAYAGAGQSLNTTLGGGGNYVSADVHDGSGTLSSDATAMDFGTSDFSFSYWSFDASNLDGDVRGPRVFDSLSGTTTGIQLGSNASGVFNYRTDDTSTQVLSNSTLTTVNQTDGRWVHIAVNMDRTANLGEIYFDNVSQGTFGIGALTGDIYPTQDMQIGVINNGNALGAAQQSGLDDLAFYTGLLSANDRTGLAAGTLTPDQIGAIPEPSSALLVLLGLAASTLRRRR